MTKHVWQIVYRYAAQHRWVRSLLLANAVYFILMFCYHVLRGIFHAYPVSAVVFWLCWLVLNIAVFVMNYLQVRAEIKKSWEN